MSQHIVSIKTYLLIFAALIVLTGVQIQVAFIDLGLWNTVVALTIAFCQALLGVLYFMHLRYSSHMAKLFWVAGFLWLVILLVLSMSDYLSRDWILPPEGWVRLN